MADEIVPPKEKKKRGRRPKLKKTDPAYYEKLGARGGSATRDRHDSDYYKRIADISHRSRRERAAERLAAQANQDK